MKQKLLKHAKSIIFAFLSLVFLMAESGAFYTFLLLSIFNIPVVVEKIKPIFEKLQEIFYKDYEEKCKKSNITISRQQLNKFYKITFILLLVIIILISIGIDTAPTKTYYTSKDPTFLYNNELKAYKRLEQFEPIKLKYKKNFNNFTQTANGDYIKNDDFVTETKANELKEKKKQELEKMLIEQKEKLQKEFGKELAKLAPNIEKAFEKIEFKNNTYSFYANPMLWYSANYEQKQAIMENCARYVMMKHKLYEIDLDTMLLTIKIKNYNNAHILGEYSSLDGFLFY